MEISLPAACGGVRVAYLLGFLAVLQEAAIKNRVRSDVEEDDEKVTAMPRGGLLAASCQLSVTLSCTNEYVTQEIRAVIRGLEAVRAEQQLLFDGVTFLGWSPNTSLKRGFCNASSYRGLCFALRSHADCPL